MTEHAEDHFGRVTVLNARRCDDHAQEIAQGVGEDVAFTSLDLFACVVATALLSNGVGALYALAVDDCRAGRGVFFTPIRRCSRRAVLMRSHWPLLVQRVKASCTVVRGGYSLGSMRHWQPVFSR